MKNVENTLLNPNDVPFACNGTELIKMPWIMGSAAELKMKYINRHKQKGTSESTVISDTPNKHVMR